MIYILLCWEFFKIGLFAVGGGLVTVPFLFDLAESYPWFTRAELTDMIAVSQSTPGPIGINMATYAGFNAAGILGALTATLSEVLPAMVIIYFVSGMLEKWKENQYLSDFLKGIRPAVIALILFAGCGIARETIVDYKSLVVFVFLVVIIHFYKKSTFFYIALSAVIGVLLQI